jgi:hypothetical protein
VIAANANVPAGFRSGIPATSLPATDFSFPSMFPFSNPYTLYAGTCPGADPSKLISNYFDVNPSLVVTLAPGVPGPTVRVLEPWVDVKVQRGTPLVARDNARVFLYPLPRPSDDPEVVAECGTRVELTGSTSSSRTNLTGNLPPTRVVGHPFGQYQICAQYTNSSSRTFHAIESFASDNPNGKTVTINLPSAPSSGNGSCPSE